MDDSSSSLLSIQCGVPQGSILGVTTIVILSLQLYIDDIQYCSKLLKFVLFADDTNIFFSSNGALKLFANINIELSLQSHWFKTNKF